MIRSDRKKGQTTQKTKSEPERTTTEEGGGSLGRLRLVQNQQLIRGCGSCSFHHKLTAARHRENISGQNQRLVAQRFNQPHALLPGADN